MATATSTLLTRTRRRLQDETDQAYGDNPLVDALNEGAWIFAATTGCCQDTATITPDGSNSYVDVSTANLTYRVVNVYGVQFSNVKLDFAPIYEATKWNPANGTPVGWSYWEEDSVERIYFDTIPAATANAVKVWYTHIPADMTTSNNCGIPEKWHPALVAYARYYIHDMNREDLLANRAWSEFTVILQAAQKTYEALLSRGGFS